MIWLFFAALALASLVIACLPYFLSTDWGTEKAVHWINRSIPGNVEITGLNLQWLGGQTIDGFRLRDPSGEIIFEVKKLTAGATLWQLLRNHYRLGSLRIDALNAVIATDKNGRTNLQKALGLYQSQEPFSEDSPPIILSNVYARSDLSVAGLPIEGQITGNTRQGNLEGSFEVNFSLGSFRFSDWEGLKKHVQKDLELVLEARIVNFPTGLLDRFAALSHPELKSLFHSFLGDRLDLTLNSTQSRKGAAFRLALLSPQMRGEIKGKLLKNVLSLEEPAHFQLDLNPRIIGKNFSIDQPSALRLSVKQFRIPLEDPLSAVVACEASIARLRLLNLSNQEAIELSGTTLAIDGSSLSSTVTNLSGQLVLLDSTGAPYPFTFKPLKFAQLSNWIIEREGTFEMPTGHLQINNSELQIDVPFQITKNHVLNMTGPLEGKWTLTPEVFDALKEKVKLAFLNLEESVLLNFNIAPVRFDLKSLSLAKMNFLSEFKAKKIRMQSTAIPLPIFEEFDLDFKALIDLGAEKKNFFTFRMDSLNFKGEGGLTFDKSIVAIDQKKPPSFQLEITPAAYQEIKALAFPQDEKILDAPVLIDFKLVQLHIPINLSWSEKGLFEFHLFTNAIKWKNTPNAGWKFFGDFESRNLANGLNFSMRAYNPLPLAQKPLTLEGEISDLFDHSGNLSNPDQMGFNAKLTGKRLTADNLRDIFPLTVQQREKLLAVFGESFNLEAACQLKNLSGPMSASINSPDGRIHLDGILQKGVLSLKHPFECSVKMTPQLSLAFFAPNVPGLGSVIGAENPITFKIEPSEFSCPLIPFEMERVNIGKATLNLGKMNFRNEGELHSILGLIGPLAGDKLAIWFTPIYLEQNKGILELKRFDMLVANTYTIANWGWVNLMTHEASFELGLPANTLEYAFGIQGLDEQYMLQVPFTSANGKVEIDKKKAMARISALLALTHGGSKGKLLGSLLDRAVSSKDQPYPEPTTQPFPWSGEFSPAPKKGVAAPKIEPSKKADAIEPQEESIEKKKKKKNKKKFLDLDKKEVQKGASHLLDQLLGRGSCKT